MLMAAGRAALGGLCVFLWCYWKRIPLFGRDGTLKPGILAGLLFGVEFVLIFLAMELTSVGRVTLMMNVMPFWVAIGSHFLLGERMSMRAFIGMCVAFLGVFVVFSDHISRPGPNAVYGDLLALISGMLWGMTTLVIKRSKLASAAPALSACRSSTRAVAIHVFERTIDPRSRYALSSVISISVNVRGSCDISIVVLDGASVSGVQIVQLCIPNASFRRTPQWIAAQ
jgi:drug/metabolite transporter (DMT)-like permease